MSPVFIPTLVWISLGAVTALALKNAKVRRGGRSQRALAEHTGLDISPGCDRFTIVDADRVKIMFLRGYVQAREAGENDPFRIALAVMKQYGTPCFPGEVPRTREALEYFRDVLDDVMDELQADGVMSFDQADDYTTAMAPWFEDQSARFGGSP